MNEAMIPELRYQSRGACILDATWSGRQSASGATLTLEPDSLLFVRSGMMRVQYPRSISWFDANHVLGAAQDTICVPGGEHGGSCTILRFDQTTFGRLPFPTEQAATRLSTPALFLRHWHALCWARTRRSETALIERAASGIFEEFAMGLGSGKDVRASSHPSLIAALAITLNEYGDAPLRLERFASAVGMSPFTVSHAFHREAGISFRHYCKRLRLRRALALMFETDADLSSIAMDLGFFDQAHFSNAFRQDFGMPPSLVMAAHRSHPPNLIAM